MEINSREDIYSKKEECIQLYGLVLHTFAWLQGIQDGQQSIANDGSGNRHSE